MPIMRVIKKDKKDVRISTVPKKKVKSFLS